MEREPSPDGGTTPGKMTWYDYPGKTGYPYNVQGTSQFASLIIKVLPDGSEWYQLFQRDQFGNPTNIISTYSVNGTVFTRTNSYLYSTNGLDLLQHVGPDGIVQASYGYDTNHGVLFMTNALNEVTSYIYNTNEQVASITSPNGLVTTNIYGSDGYLAATYDYAIVGGSPVYYRTNSYIYTNALVYTHTDERGLTVTNSWDALERLTNVVYPDGTHISYLYSNLDLVQVMDRMGHTNSYAYNSIRQKISETDALGHTTSYAYCDCGDLYAITNALNQVTIFNHDNQGNLTQVFYPDGYSVTNIYNTIHQLVVMADSGGTCISNYYNNQGLLAAVTNNAGRVQALAYDIKDRVTNSVDANGVSVGMAYDNLDRPLARSYPDNGVEHWGYTPNVPGPTGYTNQIGNAVLYGYDAMNRKTNEIYVGVTMNSFDYNGAGDLLALTDGKNQSTAWGYDSFGRVTNKVDTAGITNFVYQYDPDNRLTSRWTPARGSTTYRYDAVGNLTNVLYSLSPAIALQYDALNRLTNMVDAVGTTLYGYDAAGQLLSETGPWVNDTVSYTYTNRLRTASSLSQPSGSWSQSYGYDAARRLTNVTSAAGAFNYTLAGASSASPLIKTLSLPNGAQITNSYDSVARLLSTRLLKSDSSVLDSESYAYNLAGQRIAETNTAGDFRNYTYDNMGELITAIGKENGGTTNRLQEQFGYAYDAAGNLNYRTNNALVQTFHVNNLNELTIVTNNGTLTVAGTTTVPATNVTVNGLTANRYADATFALGGFTRTNGNNSFTAIGWDYVGNSSTGSVTVNLPGTNNYSYDLNGNLLSDGTRNFAYDDENELTNVWVANAWQSVFVYDGKLRRRVERDYSWNGGSWVQTNEIHFVYDGNVVVQERDANNNPLVTYTRGNDLSSSLQGAGGIGGLLARTDNGLANARSLFAQAYYHADGNGNITCLVYTNQQVAAKYFYDPFGNTLSMSGILAGANRYRFSSKEWNDNAGLYYYLYRYYDPNLQRWPNRDPFGEMGFELSLGEKSSLKIGQNLYEFGGNNPLNKADPFGLCPTNSPDKNYSNACKAALAAFAAASVAVYGACVSPAVVTFWPCVSALAAAAAADYAAYLECPPPIGKNKGS
jgi:RHS repeat-associated protein